MPIVTIQVTREGTRSGFQLATEKAALIKGASQLLLDVLNKPLHTSSSSMKSIQAIGDGEGFPSWSIAKARS